MIRKSNWMGVVLGVLVFVMNAQAAATYQLASPNHKIIFHIRIDQRIKYDLLLDEKVLLKDSTLAMDVDHRKLGINPQVVSAKPTTANWNLRVPVPQKFAILHEQFNELRLEFKDGYAVVFRAYNNGVAYRFETALPQNEVKIYEEEAAFNFADNFHVYYPKEDSLFSHNEREFVYLPLKEIPKTSLASIPAVIDANGPKLIIGDADVHDYPGLWFRGDSSNSLFAKFPSYPVTEELKGDRNFRVSEGADYIALTKGTRTYPWRIIGVAENDADLITNQLVYLLAKPSQVSDTRWIKPGKVAWDWYNANNIYGVNFKSGINTATYKYYIDFASKYGIEYIILDEGWYNSAIYSRSFRR